MRCEACNTILSPYEDSIVGAASNQRLGLCLGCLSGSGIAYYGNPNAQHGGMGDDEYEDEWDTK